MARGVEETNAGVCTRYLLDELEAKGPPGEDDIRLFEAERFVDRYVQLTGYLTKLFGESNVVDWRARMHRCRRALRMLSESGDHRSVAILHIAHGPPDPMTRDWPSASVDFLGPELVPLVRYTDATEIVRKRLVREELVRPRGDAATMAFVIRNCTEHRSEAGRAIGWTNSNKWERERLGELGEVVSLSRYREAEEYFDKATSSGDALRYIFGEDMPPREHGETKESWQARREARQDTRARHRAEFLVAARDEACTMLTLASRAYHRAWAAAK